MFPRIQYFFILLLICFILSTFNNKLYSQGWGWKEGRTDFVLLHDGKIKQAIKSLEKRKTKLPDHGEIHFCLAIAYAHDGNQTKAWEMAKRAIDLKVPLERFLAGPKRLLEPLVTDAFKNEFLKDANVLIHGPLLGSVTSTSASVWMRLAKISRLSVDIKPKNSQQANFKRIHAKSSASPSKEMTQRVKIVGLSPNTEYEYRLVFDGKVETKTYLFKTFPQKGQASEFTIAFGGGSAYFTEYEFMFNQIAHHQPLSFLQLGDNVYIDDPTRPQVQQYCYYRRQSSPPYRALVASTNIAAIWDDHDFGDDDCHGGLLKDFPLWKRPTLEVFRNNWCNPYYGGGDTDPGVYFDFSIGDVDFFLLDCRYYRTSPKTKTEKSMLGSVQKAWLKKKLSESKATFKVIATSVPFSTGVKPGSKDPWDGYPKEREELFSFIESNKIEGVFLISADRHRSDAWKTERKEGYDLYEFQSSRLTNIHVHRVLKNSIFGFNKDRSFGLLKFKTNQKDPQVTYTIQDSKNNEVWSFKLNASQLKSK